MMVATVIGTLGTIAGFISAYFWLAAARVQPVYNTAVLSGPNPEEKKRVDTMASLNARAAIATAVAVGCQAIIVALGVLHISA